jgi:hypothetical protein
VATAQWNSLLNLTGQRYRRRRRSRAKTAADFTPIFFFDPDGFWEHDAEFDKHGVTRPSVNVRDLIQKVFRYGRTDSVAVLNKVRFTVDFDEIDAVLFAHAPIAQQSLAFSLASV